MFEVVRLYHLANEPSFCAFSSGLFSGLFAPVFPSPPELVFQYGIFRMTVAFFSKKLQNYVLFGLVFSGCFIYGIGLFQSVVLPEQATFNRPFQDPWRFVSEFVKHFGHRPLGFFRDCNREGDHVCSVPKTY